MNRSLTATMTAMVLIPSMMALSYPQSAGQTFEVATVKPFKDGNAAGGVVMVGGGCRGIDSGTPAAGGPPQAMTVTVGGPPPGAGGGVGAGPGGPPPGGPGGRLGPAPLGRCVYSRMNLKMLINAAYRLTALGGSLDQMLSGGPGWISTDAWDIEAKAEDPEHVTQDQLRVMLQNLLVERFQLKFHREKKEMQGFDLVVAKGGVKMKEADGSETRPGSMSMSLGNPAAPGMATFNAQGATMSSIVSFLSGRLGRAINDKSGLTGKYNFTLSWAPGENESLGRIGVIAPLPSAGATASEPGISIFTALQEQMGLRLESAKVMIETFVIDSAERPAEQH